MPRYYYRRATRATLSIYRARDRREPCVLIDNAIDTTQTSVLYLFFFSFYLPPLSHTLSGFSEFPASPSGTICACDIACFRSRGGMAESTHSERYARNVLSGCNSAAVIFPLSSRFYRTGVNPRERGSFAKLRGTNRRETSRKKEACGRIINVIYKIDQMFQISMPVVTNDSLCDMHNYICTV